MSDKYQRLASLAPEQLAVLVMRLSAKIEDLENRRHEPIAIIGVGCRFPGGVTDAEGFWRLLQERGDAITDIPPERWDVESYYSPNPEAPGRMYVKKGGFLGAVDAFDPQFFRISPAEATWMDPQQRLLLEVSWEALENAGQPPSRLARTEVGNFVGIMGADYETLQSRCCDFAEYNAHTATGIARSVNAGRLSYVLGLQGPAMVLDTACSSSLVAIHLACRSLRTGECEMALASGTNLVLSPTSHVFLSKGHMLSPDGQCKTFDARADGYVRGEGCGVVVLKRLSDAVAGRDRILALVKGSAVNHDGPSSALTAPSGPAQQAVIRRALEDARIDPAMVAAVEAHGTGTSLGDPIEVGSLGAVFGAERAAASRLALGSVKTNVGHLEPASGVAGLIKMVMALQREELPPHLHLREVNPHVGLDALPVSVVGHRTPWVSSGGPRVAGVSSFGLSGTNAHVVLEEAPAAAPPDPDGAARPPARPLNILALSARSPGALRDLAARYASRLANDPDLALADVFFSANTGRSHFEHRLAVQARDADEAVSHLGDPDRWESWSGEARGWQAPKIAFLFTCMGGEYAGMGRQLYETQPSFRSAMDRCAAVLEELVDRPLLDILHGPDAAELLEQMRYSQPALFSLEYAVFELWRSWGVAPAAIMGHSMGELVAACAAGVYSLEDGLKLTSHRGRLMQEQPGGEMVSIRASEELAADAIDDLGGDVSIAVVNGPESVVLSGRVAAMDAVVSRLEARGVECRRVKVSHASHSPLMDEMLDPYERVAAELEYSSPGTALVSTLLGRVVEDEVCSREYWRRNVREGVQFSRGMAALAELGCNVFVEMGPAPTLIGMAQHCLDDPGLTWLPSLRHDRGDWEQILESLGQLYMAGGSVDWRGFDQDYSRAVVALPTYPFQRSPYWIRSLGASQSPRRAAGPGSPFLGQAVVRSTIQVHEARWRIESPSFLVDHQLHGMVVSPGAGYLDLVMEACAASFGEGPRQLEDVIFREPMVFRSRDDERAVQVVLSPDGSGGQSFQVISQLCDEGDPSAPWVEHAAGVVRRGPPAPGECPEGQELSAVRARVNRPIDVGEYYAAMRNRGLEYGEAFQRIEALFSGDGESLGVSRYSAGGSPDEPHHIFPGVLDACFQSLGAAWPSSTWRAATDEPHIPLGVDSFTVLRRAGDEVWCHVVRRPDSDPSREAYTVDLRLFDGEGVLGEMSGLHLKRAQSAALLRMMGQDAADLLYEERWEPREPGETRAIRPDDGTWVICADAGGAGELLAAELERRGGRCVVVIPGEQYGELGDRRYQIDPGAAADVDRVLEAAHQGATTGVSGIIHMWSLDEPAVEDPSTRWWNESQVPGCGTVLFLVQALARNVELGEPDLYLVTRGAQATAPGEGVSVVQTPLWGLGRVIALEHPEFNCVRIDLDRSSPSGDVAGLADEVWNPDGEDEVALRGGGRMVRRLGRTRGGAGSVELEPGGDGSTLIVGGLGGLGLRLARWLVERGAGHLVLAGRSGGDEAASREITALKELGASIEVARLDVTDETQVKALVESFGDKHPPLRGVFHLAAVLDDHVLQGQSWERFERVFGPKLGGTWNLHHATQGLALEQFVLFSSAASQMGNAGQGNYAAACAFQDGVAHFRRSQGQPAVSINWGPWAEVGLAVEAVERGIGAGIEAMSPGEALAAMERILRSGAAQVGVLKRDWAALIESLPPGGEPAALRDIVRAERERLELTTEAARGPRLVAQLEALPEARRQKFLVGYLQEKVAAMLGFDRPGLVSPGRPLMELGLDSMMALDLRNTLRTALGCTIPATLVFDYPTVNLLVQFVAGEVLDLTSGGDPDPEPAAALMEDDLELGDLLADVEQLSPDQVKSALGKKEK